MQFKIKRESLLKPLQSVMSAIDQRHSLPILSNVLLNLEPDTLILTGTNLEVEQKVTVTELVEVTQPGSITVPAKKLFDICKALPEGAILSLALEQDNLLLKSGKSKFKLSTLSASDYPNTDVFTPTLSADVPSAMLAELIGAVAFSMADQDVRYYLNGMLFEFSERELTLVSTDGHRLSVFRGELPQPTVSDGGKSNAILPKKSVLDLLKSLSGGAPAMIPVSMNANMMRFELGAQVMTTKLIDGRFPDYRRVLPRELPIQVEVDRAALKDALVRVNILSNEKFRGAVFSFGAAHLSCSAKNTTHEHAEEVVDIKAPATTQIDIGFNIGYVLDILNTIKSEKIHINLADGNNSAIIVAAGQQDGALYVVMPMRL